nr:MAG TPA: hypothetical protein [Caudoviricetes sp.]
MFKIPFEVYQFLMLIGFPAFFMTSGKVLMSRIKLIDSENKSLKQGVQALLRDRLYGLYNDYRDRGYAPLYAKENFKNMYRSYHNLGENGVMDSIYIKFMALPEMPESEQ